MPFCRELDKKNYALFFQVGEVMTFPCLPLIHGLRLSQCVYMHSFVGLQPQFDYATQSDNCYYPSIKAGEKIGLLGQSMSYPGMLGGAVPISTSGKRNTSG